MEVNPEAFQLQLWCLEKYKINNVLLMICLSLKYYLECDAYLSVHVHNKKSVIKMGRFTPFSEIVKSHVFKEFEFPFLNQNKEIMQKPSP